MFILGISISNNIAKRLFRNILIFLLSILLVFFISHKAYSGEADKLPVVEIGRASCRERV